MYGHDELLWYRRGVKDSVNLIGMQTWIFAFEALPFGCLAERAHAPSLCAPRLDAVLMIASPE